MIPLPKLHARTAGGRHDRSAADRTRPLTRAAQRGVTEQRRAPPPSAPSRGLSLVEVRGSQELDLLALSQQPSTASPGAAASPSRGPHLPPLASLPSAARELFLPPGFPESVTPDYLPYQLWSVPTHVTGHLSHALVTSSLLAAVGVSAGPATTVALSASIKWIVKDGVGALGRLIVGSRLNVEFDEDPRRWRLVAEALSTAGMGLEVATSLVPMYFLPLACAGKFCQALGKGMGKPVFRVIQTHFAVAANVGAVAAKEEVWEVVAQMAGLAASVAVLRALEATGNPDGVVTSWAAIQAVHVALRYQALRQLAFPTLSTKRAAMLAAADVARPAGQPLPGVAELNAREPPLSGPWDVRPRVRLGVGVAEAFGGSVPEAGVLEAYSEAYDREGYILVWRDRGAHVVLKEGYGQTDLLRAVWQAAWLDWRTSGGGENSAASEIVGSGSGGGGSGARDALPLLLASLAALEGGFDAFLDGCRQAGWQVGVVHMKAGRSRLRVGVADGPEARAQTGLRPNGVAAGGGPASRDGVSSLDV
ncbi:hypothetical protein GPECTOR_1g865 [Gonium pectorale]|uniref:Vitamin B6 photo-protection and homoeostasis-domain-containing protein n=1 Tax=Gonium pectorale TaxID=33097 RepID=A0A150H489_GONPE|nr:hypothetical protein GPECTOR_1g865 [Gonium pectorale]|eukprot:KXZ56959.1 hypothetical protein GPECTOR_1g865 [Gonium pectorale]